MNRSSEKDNLKLPQSGLAHDILKGMEKSEKEQEEVRSEVAAHAESIYTFADQLNKDGNGGNEQKEEQLETWVTFSLAGEYFGLPVSNVREILRTSLITRVPHAPQSVRGVTNMRGRVLPVVDLRVRLGLRETDVDQLSRILVVESKGRLIGLLVDSVQQVVRLAINKVQPLSPDVMTAQSDYILGVYHLQDVLVILLNVDYLLLIRDSLKNA